MPCGRLRHRRFLCSADLAPEVSSESVACPVAAGACQACNAAHCHRSRVRGIDPNGAAPERPSRVGAFFREWGIAFRGRGRRDLADEDDGRGSDATIRCRLVGDRHDRIAAHRPLAHPFHRAAGSACGAGSGMDARSSSHGGTAAGSQTCSVDPNRRWDRSALLVGNGAWADRRRALPTGHGAGARKRAPHHQTRTVALRSARPLDERLLDDSRRAVLVESSGLVGAAGTADSAGVVLRQNGPCAGFQPTPPIRGGASQDSRFRRVR